MDGITKIFHEAHLKFQRERCGGRSIDSVNDKVRTGNHREPPKLNMSRAMQDHLCFDYYKYFCEHDRLRIEKCTKCKRKGIVG